MTERQFAELLYVIVGMGAFVMADIKQALGKDRPFDWLCVFVFFGLAIWMQYG